MTGDYNYYYYFLVKWWLQLYNLKYLHDVYLKELYTANTLYNKH